MMGEKKKERKKRARGEKLVMQGILIARFVNTVLERNAHFVPHTCKTYATTCSGTNEHRRPPQVSINRDANYRWLKNTFTNNL